MGVVTENKTAVSAIQEKANVQILTPAGNDHPETDGVLLADSILKARGFRFLKCQAPHGGEATLSSILAVLSPLDSMPVVNDLADERGLAVEVIVPVNQLDRLTLELHKIGTREITVTAIDRYVP